MYKPNGEERMTQQEEKRRRESVAERRMERERAAIRVGEALGTTIYASLLHTAGSRASISGITCENLR
jgi:hypothetical protein